ncbi:hypothetical protein GT037_002642 [Alternaria burnsii]|uniref:Uncharacterized protein n=1 Tax=Alternaria burnsii TaxID=1187904 RepID=A0A8H7EK99_9PLEO|nr:uncharacterized protein GT037_002642 [Alternaria burnsii]KAF7678894.1 hypothetical protein GT037_002642 [Alternaria burnsii]
MALFIRRALESWKSRHLEWEQGGKTTLIPRRWTQEEKEDAKISAMKEMNLEHQPIVAPQESSTRQDRTAAQKKKDSRQQAVTAANIYTWENVKARGAFEAAYEKHAMEVNERRHRENPSGRWTGMKADDQRDLVEHAAKYLQKLFKDDQIPPGLKRRPTQGVSLGGAGGSDNSHVQGSTAKQTFQTTIKSKEVRRLGDIPYRYPPGYDSEGGSSFSGMSSPNTKSPSASELESHRPKGKGKAKATDPNPHDRAHEASFSDDEYHEGDFLTREWRRDQRHEQARIAERNQEALRMHMEANQTQVEAARPQSYIQSNVQPQQARVATKPISSTTSKSPATRDIRVAAGKQQAAKLINPNDYPTVAEYPPGYNSSGSSNPPNTPPITNEQAYYDMMNQDFTTHHWAVNRSGDDEIHAESQPRDTREQSPIHRSGKTAAAGKQRAVEAHQTQPKKSTASGAAKATSNVSTTGAAKQKLRGQPRQLAQTTSDTTRQTTNVPAAGIPRFSTEAHTTASNPAAGSSTGGPTRRGTEDSASSSKTKNSKQDSKKKTTKKPSSGT